MQDPRSAKKDYRLIDEVSIINGAHVMWDDWTEAPARICHIYVMGRCKGKVKGDGDAPVA